MRLALVRNISPRFNECELTHIRRTPIDLQVAEAEHYRYVRAIQELGCSVLELPADPDLPDSVFVEDTAVILPEVALITRPGADSRKPEIHAICEALQPYRPLIAIEPPGSLDGGDVLVMGKNIWVGLSTRSNLAAVSQMQRQLAPYGYSVQEVPLQDCLHLKTAVTRVDDRTLLINPHWVNAETFAEYDLIEVDEAEPFAANCLPLEGSILYPASFPRTAARLTDRGYRLKLVPVAELAKAEGAVTCCSLIIESP